MYFWTYRLRKTWLDKCLKSPVSEDPLISNLAKGLKHCSKLNDSILTVFVDASERNLGSKSFSDIYAKS